MTLKSNNHQVRRHFPVSNDVMEFTRFVEDNISTFQRDSFLSGHYVNHALVHTDKFPKIMTLTRK